MDGFANDVRLAADVLENIEKDRDAALMRSRAVIRLSKRVIHAIHAGEPTDDLLDELDKALDDLLSAETPEIMLSAIMQDAMMEYAEAVIFESVIREGTVPSASKLGISAGSWVLGLADCIGELRRVVTADIMKGDLESAQDHFAFMEEIAGELMLLDVPDAVAPVRRKQDIARGIMDRTRSDMTAACLMLRRECKKMT